MVMTEVTQCMLVFVCLSYLLLFHKIKPFGIWSGYEENFEE